MTTNTRWTNYGPLVLRAGLGGLFVAHALVKLFVFTLPGTAAFFEKVGFPGFMAYPVFATELVGGLLLLAGYKTRWAALALVPVMVGASSVHWANGWTFSNPGGGWEFTAFLAVAALALFLDGRDGAFSLAGALSGATAEDLPVRSGTRRAEAA